MNKRSVLNISIYLIFIVVFNVLFFLIGGKSRETSVWISYGFIQFSYLMFVLTPLLTPKSSESSLFKSTIGSLSFSYFSLTFIIDLIFILVNSSKYIPCLIINIMLMSIYLILLLVNMSANEDTKEKIATKQVELNFIRDCSYSLKRIMDEVSDKDLNKKIEKIYDDIHCSPVKSNNEAREVEQSIIDLIETLESTIKRDDKEKSKDIINKIRNNIAKRNELLKYQN